MSIILGEKDGPKGEFSSSRKDPFTISKENLLTKDSGVVNTGVAA
jgi:hypothetical protein